MLFLCSVSSQSIRNSFNLILDLVKVVGPVDLGSSEALSFAIRLDSWTVLAVAVTTRPLCLITVLYDPPML
jgi:hypothetical protein